MTDFFSTNIAGVKTALQTASNPQYCLLVRTVLLTGFNHVCHIVLNYPIISILVHTVNSTEN